LFIFEGGIKEQQEINLLIDRSILDDIYEGILIIDADFRVLHFNQRAKEITEYSKTEATGKRCYEVLKLSNCGDGCPVRGMLKKDQSFVDYQSELIRKDGHRIPISIRFSIWRRANGKFNGGIICIRDLPTRVNILELPEKSYSFQNIVTRNRRILEIFEIIPDISRTDASVLIQGESGTGKELFSQALHNLSHRQNGPLIKVNCAALPETLLESELFGYVRGAFTDAKKDKPGRFQMADGGSLFLDEIGDLSTSLQVKLLRAVQEKEFVPLGSTHSVSVDVRVISATNRDLERLVKEGRFRQDLYYRLNVIKLEIPSLRERPEDIPPLVEHFLRKLNERHNNKIYEISGKAMDILLHYSFPGNVRELENILEHAYILCKGTTITDVNLPSYLLGIEHELKKIDLRGNVMNDVTNKAILRMLNKHNWNRSKAAEELGIHRTTLWRKLRKIDSPN
jgi:PAS domain S-box-containing protein